MTEIEKKLLKDVLILGQAASVEIKGGILTLINNFA